MREMRGGRNDSDVCFLLPRTRLGGPSHSEKDLQTEVIQTEAAYIPCIAVQMICRDLLLTDRVSAVLSQPCLWRRQLSGAFTICSGLTVF